MDELESKRALAERYLESVPEELSKSVRSLVLERGLSPHSMALLARSLALWWELVGVKPEEADEEHIRSFLSKLVEKGIGDSTSKQYLARVKQLARYRAGGEVPRAWRKVKVRVASREEKRREEILNPEEIEALVKTAENVKHKAIIAVLYEGALRASELCSLRMKDLEFTEFGFRVRVAGKTGVRTIPLVNSAPYIRNWLQVHPDPGDPNAPLFPGKGKRPLGRQALGKIVARVAERAKLGRKVHPHTLRHTRLTELAKHLTEQELKVFAGWTQDSSMAAVYVHLSGRDAERAILRAYGVEEVEKEEKERVQPLKPQVCPNCGYVNPKDARFCSRCGHPLGEEAVREVKRVGETVDWFLDLLMEDPRVREILLSKLREKMS